MKHGSISDSSEDFSHLRSVQVCSGTHAASYAMGTGTSYLQSDQPIAQSGWLITYVLLMLGSKIIGAKQLLPPYIFMAYTWTTLHLWPQLTESFAK